MASATERTMTHPSPTALEEIRKRHERCDDSALKLAHHDRGTLLTHIAALEAELAADKKIKEAVCSQLEIADFANASLALACVQDELKRLQAEAQLATRLPDREALATIIEHAMHCIEWDAGKRPSIEDLERILKYDVSPPIKLLPDGSITASEPRDGAYKAADQILALLSGAATAEQPAKTLGDYQNPNRAQLAYEEVAKIIATGAATPAPTAAHLRRFREQTEAEVFGYVTGVEDAAALYESVNPASDDERIKGSPGAGAMGAVIEYRDKIRDLLHAKSPPQGAENCPECAGDFFRCEVAAECPNQAATRAPTLTEDNAPIPGCSAPRDQCCLNPGHCKWG